MDSILAAELSGKGFGVGVAVGIFVGTGDPLGVADTPARAVIVGGALVELGDLSEVGLGVSGVGDGGKV
jgi:hypothetical protein